MDKKIVKKQNIKGFQNLNVIQSNLVTRSAQSLSLVEKRILMTALAQSGGIAKPVKFSAQEYADTFELNIKTAYLELLNAVETFKRKGFTLPTIVENSKARSYFNWLLRIDYLENEAVLIVYFNPEINKFLFDLTEKFTKYKLKQASALRSIYSIRLLELLEQMRTSLVIKKDTYDNNISTKKKMDGWLSISIKEFNHAMDTPKSYQNNFKDLRKRIIEPSIKELQDKDNWKIEWNAIKKGRKFDRLEFNFYKNPQEKLL